MEGKKKFWRGIVTAVISLLAILIICLIVKNRSWTENNRSVSESFLQTDQPPTEKGKDIVSTQTEMLNAETLKDTQNSEKPTEEMQVNTEPAIETATKPATEEEKAAWKAILPEGMTVKERFAVPEGFERMVPEAGSFAEYIQNYPLLPDGEKVHLYNGSLKGRQNVHVAVFDLPLVDGDLQQCADSVMRLYAQYYFDRGQYDKMKFHFVNGFCCDYSIWRQGKRVKISGNDAKWIDKGKTGDSQESFEEYLRIVFGYASTLSLQQESKEKDLANILPGDIFIKGGSPGHVVMVLDVCENQQGEKAFLLGQGYMPAQQFHVLKNPNHEDSPWYYVSEVTAPFRTAEYTFPDAVLRAPYAE